MDAKPGYLNSRGRTLVDPFRTRTERLSIRTVELLMAATMTTMPVRPATPMARDMDIAATPDGYCAQRFRSYDPASGTYLGYDGERHSCP